MVKYSPVESTIDISKALSTPSWSDQLSNPRGRQQDTYQDHNWATEKNVLRPPAIRQKHRPNLPRRGRQPSYVPARLPRHTLRTTVSQHQGSKLYKEGISKRNPKCYRPTFKSFVSRPTLRHKRSVVRDVLHVVCPHLKRTPRGTPPYKIMATLSSDMNHVRAVRRSLDGLTLCS